MIGQNGGRRIGLNAESKKDRFRICHGSFTKNRCAKTLLIGHNLVVIYRLIEMD